MKTLTCPCGAVARIEDTSNIGEMRDQSGFMPVFTHSQQYALLWVCPACKEKLRPAARAIAQVFGLETEHLSWFALYKGLTK